MIHIDTILSMSLHRPLFFEKQIVKIIDQLTEGAEKERATLYQQASWSSVNQINSVFIATYDSYLYHYRMDEIIQATGPMVPATPSTTPNHPIFTDSPKGTLTSVEMSRTPSNKVNSHTFTGIQYRFIQVQKWYINSPIHQIALKNVNNQGNIKTYSRIYEFYEQS